MEHALDCRVGGLVCQRHNEVRDAICDLASLAWGQVQKEPVVCEEKMDDPSSETLIADVRIRGVWQSQAFSLASLVLSSPVNRLCRFNFRIGHRTYP